MSRCFTLAILSDIHYAGAAEQAVGDDYEIRAISNPLLRRALRAYRHYIWLRHPLQQNGQLDRFLAEVGPVDYVIANGDYSCNTAAIGLSDEAAMQSARECLDKLRGRFGDRLLTNFGDHELGKLRLLGTRGGMRLHSWQRCVKELDLRPFWKLELGNYVLLSVVSSLVALPVFERDMLPEERPAWEQLRAEHFTDIRTAFAALQPHQRVLLFCHDPTALPFLWREELVRGKLAQIEHTIIGHLHSNLILKTSKLLAGMPVIGFLGHSIRRMSTALNDARLWRPFRVRLCPSLAGIELLKDGGYLTTTLDAAAPEAARFECHRLPR
ncbi:MAG: metallophosphoesterase [Verrucomicrobia bacterium]|nr:metallophosphoesterase [Verrucomicrobiota bacterium]